MKGALSIVSSNFEHDQQRDYIMQIICSACNDQDGDIQSTALCCLFKIAELYYEFLNDTYMQVIWSVSELYIRIGFLLSFVNLFFFFFRILDYIQTDGNRFAFCSFCH